MPEKRPIQIRREEGTCNLDVMFDGRWLGLCTMGTTSFEVARSAASANARYRALAERCTLLLLAAPDLLKALKGLMEIAKVAMPDTYFQTDSRVKAARTAIAKTKVKKG